jgi:hypothetical protein
MGYQAHKGDKGEVVDLGVMKEKATSVGNVLYLFTIMLVVDRSP